MRDKSKYFLPGLKWLLEKYLIYASTIEAWRVQNKLPIFAQYLPELLLLSLIISIALLYILLVLYIIMVMKSIRINS